MNVKNRRAFSWGLGLLLLGCLMLSPFLQAQNFEAIAKKIKVKTLKNGLKFIVLERHEAPVVYFHVYADVGSANESYGITGISHLLEHMAFKGTKTVGTKNYEEESKILEEMDALYARIRAEEAKPHPDEAKLKKMKAEFEALRQKAKEYVITDEFVDLLMQEGDRSVNAYTSNDATQYINSLPSNKVEFWMAITSDRFLNPVFREFYKEKEVVMEERRLSVETRPLGRLLEDFQATAFKAHPYHHEVIGHMSDIQAITREDVRHYFRKYYNPANLTVAIVGDVNPEEVFRLAELYFGRIPSGEKPEPVRTVEPEQWGERRVAVEAMAQPFLLIGYHRPSVRHQDNFALEALASILGEGRSSRLYRRLVKETQVAIECGVINGFPGDKFPHLIIFYAVPARGHSVQECLGLIEEEIEKVKKELPKQEELLKYKRQAGMSLLQQMKSHARMAALLTYAEVILGDWRELFRQIEKINAVTAEDVQRVARKYLIKKNRTIGELVPQSSR
ncbi:MAG: insulinase family protein [Candidatus Aminicenantes bacterium]|nr:MAG: insulinase family protein [Candidatus Aminicenantes bacterium]